MVKPKNVHFLSSAAAGGSDGGPTVPADQIDLGQLLAVVWARRWVLLAVVVAAVSLAGLYLLRTNPVYTAATQLLIGQPALPLGEFRRQEDADGLRRDAAAVNTELAVLRSQGLARRVADALRLAELAEFNPALETAPQAAPSAPMQAAGAVTTAQVVDAFQQRLRVSVAENSRFVTVSFSATDPVLAARAANTLVEFYLHDQRQAKLQAARQAGAWLDAQVEELQQRVLTADRAVERFRLDNGLLLDAEGKPLLARNLAVLNAELQRAAGDRAAAEARLTQAQKLLSGSGDSDALAGVADLQAVQTLRAREQQLQRELDELRSLYSDKNLRVVAAGRELALVRDKIAAAFDDAVGSLQLQLEVATQRQQALEQRLAAAEQRNAEAELAAVELRGLQRAADADRALLESQLAQAKQLRPLQDDALRQADARVISRAEPPVEPRQPRPLPILAASAVGASFIGMLAVLLFEQVRQKVRGPRLARSFYNRSQVELATGAPVIGSVPLLSWPAQVRHTPAGYFLHAKNSAFAAAFRNLYTYFAAARIDSRHNTPLRKILIASTHSQEGKTTTAVCLARAEALAGKNVIVVDADLRNPGVHRALKMPPQAGLFDIIAGEALFANVVQTDRPTGAHVLQAGKLAPDPPDLLASKAMDRLLRRLEKTYDLVIIDSPPLLSASDARILSRKVDLTLFVLRWGYTDRDEARLALKRITNAGAQLAGVLFTMVDRGRQGLRDVYSDYGGTVL